MGWSAYELFYEALSPIHIGTHKLGIIQRTRYYIPSRAMWGTATVGLAREWLASPDSDGNVDEAYRKAGVEVAKNYLFSYFYPVVKGPVGMVSYLPGRCEVEDEAQVANPELDLIASLTGTAIDNSSRSAEEGSLHETEFISHRRKTDGRPVYLLGYLFIREREEAGLEWEAEGLSLKRILSDIGVGGEQKYGFGRLRLVCNKKLGKGEAIWSSWATIKDLDGEAPVLTIEGGWPILSHLLLENITDGASGTVEPLVGRIWSTSKDRRGAGQRTSTAVIGYAPGSLVSKSQEFEVLEGHVDGDKATGDRYGCWKLLT